MTEVTGPEIFRLKLPGSAIERSSDWRVVSMSCLTAVRHVLATHIPKQVGSCEQASYAIEDTAEMVAQHQRWGQRRTSSPGKTGQDMTSN